MLNQEFEGFVEIDELDALCTQDAGVHPIVSVALRDSTQELSQIAHNTCRALRLVRHKFPEWADSLKLRLLDPNDWTNAESALAEIRACGALIEAGFPIQLGSKNAASGAKPDFCILMDEIETIVEVWARNQSKEEKARIKDQQTKSSRSEQFNGGKITISEAAAAPFDAPNPSKEGDSVLTNVISRIATIKEREHQAHDCRPFVLWIDLQSESLKFDYSDNLQPLMNWHGEVQSGGYWHALYGRKGDILLERTRTNCMKHEGRYYQHMKHGRSTRISACIFSSPKTTAIMEHPAAEFPLTASFRRQVIKLPWFDIGLSLANWSKGLVERTVDVQREFVAAVVQALAAAFA